MANKVPVIWKNKKAKFINDGPIEFLNGVQLEAVLGDPTGTPRPKGTIVLDTDAKLWQATDNAGAYQQFSTGGGGGALTIGRGLTGDGSVGDPLRMSGEYRPQADSTTAFEVRKADGVTPVFTVDSLNNKVSVTATYVPTLAVNLTNKGYVDTEDNKSDAYVTVGASGADYTNLNSAIDYVSARGGGTILIIDNLLNYTAAAKNVSNIRFVGKNSDETAGASMIFWNAGSGAWTGTNVTFENIVIRGRPTGTNHLLTYTESGHLTFINCWFLNDGAGGSVPQSLFNLNSQKVKVYLTNTRCESTGASRYIFRNDTQTTYHAFNRTQLNIDTALLVYLDAGSSVIKGTATTTTLVDKHNSLDGRDLAGNHAKLVPVANSTTGLQITRADGTTALLTIDSVNNKLIAGSMYVPTDDYHLMTRKHAIALIEEMMMPIANVEVSGTQSVAPSNEVELATYTVPAGFKAQWISGIGSSDGLARFRVTANAADRVPAIRNSVYDLSVSLHAPLEFAAGTVIKVWGYNDTPEAETNSISATLYFKEIAV
jgi:hypothetical protein